MNSKEDEKRSRNNKVNVISVSPKNIQGHLEPYRWFE